MGAFAIVVILLGLFLYALMQSSQGKVKDYNKRHRTKFKTWQEMREHQAELEEKHLEKEQRKALKEEKQKEQRKTLKEEQRKKKRLQKKENFAKTTFSGSGLTSKIARLQKLYKNGTLTKAEFEQAKNKLLK